MTNALKFMEELNGPVTVGTLIRAYRTRNDLTLEALAKIIGQSKSYVSDLEHDRKPVSITLLRVFAEKMGESVELFAKVWIEQRLKEANIEGLFDFKLTHRPLSERIKDKTKSIVSVKPKGNLDRYQAKSTSSAKSALVKIPHPVRKAYAKKASKKAAKKT
jgi:transcriptional regulator with XRE-family HTH domain